MKENNIEINTRIHVKYEKQQTNEYPKYITIDKNNHPFNENLIPTEYPHFPSNEIHLYNISKLCEELNRIKKPFENELGGLNSKNEFIIFNENDWESELCYTQGKYMENLSWIWDVPVYSVPEENGAELITKITYRKLSQNQLAYYLYWRTEFKKGHYLSGYQGCYYLFFYELVVGIGNFDKDTTIMYLDNIIQHCPRDKRIKSAINNFIKSSEECHYEKTFSEWERDQYAIEIKKCVRMCDVNIRMSVEDCISLCIPKIKEIFTNKGLNFWDFFLGKCKMETIYCKSTIWTNHTLKRVLNKKIPCRFLIEKKHIRAVKLNESNKFSIIYYYPDTNLRNYICKLTEIELSNYLYSTKKEMKYPLGITDPSCKVRTNIWIPLDEEERKIYYKYFSLYPAIENIIKNIVKDYIENNKNIHGFMD